MKNYKTFNIEFFDGDDLYLVEGIYYPGHPGVHTLANGDPGYPSDPDEIDVAAVVKNGTEFTVKQVDEFNCNDKLMDATFYQASLQMEEKYGY